MKGQATLFSKQSDNWATPKNLYEELDKEFNFNFDPCPLNCEYDSLQIDCDWGERCFVNPPYSKIRDFVDKGKRELQKNTKLIVWLLPARTDTKWFHEYFYKKPNVEIRFIKGRLKFGDSKNSAPFPSMIVIQHG